VCSSDLLLTDGDMDNLEADILRDLYNPARKGFFNAYIFGKKLSDLRYFVRPRGALPQMNTPSRMAMGLSPVALPMMRGTMSAS